MMGYDTRFFNGEDDGHMIVMARKEGRVILTKDTQIMVRRVVTTGQVSAVLINSDQPEAQMRQVVATLNLDPQHNPFSICLECNQPLVERSKDEVRDQVPPYVFKTQNQYMQCPNCHRIYWRGTHWRAMHQKLLGFLKDSD